MDGRWEEEEEDSHHWEASANSDMGGTPTPAWSTHRGSKLLQRILSGRHKQHHFSTMHHHTTAPLNGFTRYETLTI